MDELGRARAGAAGVVVALDERDRVPARGGVERDPRARDPAADHEHVERLAGERGDGVGARQHVTARYRARAAMSAGFVQALWRFPVLGMAGEQLRSTQIDARGVAGDRQHYAAGPEGRLDGPGPARSSRTGTATFPFNPDGAIHTAQGRRPTPMLTGPGGGEVVPLGRPAARPTRSSARWAARSSSSATSTPPAASSSPPSSRELDRADRGRERPARAAAAGARRLGGYRADLPRRRAAASSWPPARTVRVSRLEWSKPAALSSASPSRSVRLRVPRPCQGGCDRRAAHR